MIVTNRKITIGIDKSVIDEPVVLYRGDYEVEIRFTLDDSKFKFLSGVNVIETDKPSYAQLAILRPDADNIFSNITKCSEGVVSFVLTKEMIDQINEVGSYSFHIRMFDYNKTSRVTIPPVEFGIEVREPIASEDKTNNTNSAQVGYSIIKAASLDDTPVGPTFDSSGNYNKTNWENGDRITEGKLNKIEDAIKTINQNEKNDKNNLEKRINSDFNILDSIKSNKTDKIKSSQLDTSSNDAKIKLINLSDEVQKAMAGTSSVNPVIADGSITTEKYANSSITRDKIVRNIQQTYIFQEGKVIDFTFNNSNRTFTITTGADAFLIIGNDYLMMNDTYGVGKVITLNYPDNMAGVTTLWFKPSTKQFILANYQDYGTYNLANDKESVIIATISMGSNKIISCLCEFTVNSKSQLNDRSITELKISRSAVPTYIYSQGYLVFKIEDYNKRVKLTLPPYTYICQAYRYYALSEGSGKTIYMDMPKNKDGTSYVYHGVNYIVFNTSDNSLSIYNFRRFDEIDSSNFIILGTISFYGVYNIYMNGNYRLDMYDISTMKQWATYNSRSGYINFNWVDRVIEIPTYGYVIIGNKWYTPNLSNAPGGKLPIEDYADGIQWLLYSLTTNQFKTVRYTSIDNIINDQKNGWVTIATFWVGGPVQSINTCMINGKLPGVCNTAIDLNFNIDDNKLILPNSIFLVKGDDLPIYASSIIPNDAKTLAIKPSVIYKDGLTRRIDTIYDSYNLYCDKLSSSIRIGFRQYTNNKLYYKDITKIYKDPSTVSNKTPKILHMGDSITNRNIAAQSEKFLNAWGITPTYVGTVVNLGSKRGEGREGWSYPNFTGKGNIWGNNGSVIVPKTTGTTTTLNENPFLKIATGEDISKYPDWCFRNTGAKRELSYSDDTDKTGNFYIFDISSYLSSHSVDTPDIITIALSTNDINRDEDALEMCQFNMKLMISRIREQLPNVKIGIIPSPTWGVGNSTFKNKTVTWIEKCMKIIYELGDTNVYIVPIWCHINKEWAFPMSNGGTISSDNTTNIATLSDTIHLSTVGEEQYGKAMASFVVNML